MVKPKPSPREKKEAPKRFVRYDRMVYRPFENLKEMLENKEKDNK